MIPLISTDCKEIKTNFVRSITLDPLLQGRPDLLPPELWILTVPKKDRALLQTIQLIELACFPGFNSGTSE